MAPAFVQHNEKIIVAGVWNRATKGGCVRNTEKRPVWVGVGGEQIRPRLYFTSKA